MRAPAGMLVITLALSVPREGVAQAPLTRLTRAGMSQPLVDDAPVRPGRTRDVVALRDPWWLPVASAVVPGSGQLLLRQDRALAYMAMEAFVAALYLRDRQEARRQREAYRELARTVARALFENGGLPDGNFDYYERMEKFVESGVYDLVPGGAVDPETDESTYNGAMWRLARETYWKLPGAAPPVNSPEYQRAVNFYVGRAVKPQFRWSWRNAQLEHDLFLRTIEASNRAFRRTIADLGVLLANHTLSTVDAYVTLRLRWRTPPGRGDEPMPMLEASLPWAPLGRP